MGEVIEREKSKNKKIWNFFSYLCFYIYIVKYSLLLFNLLHECCTGTQMKVSPQNGVLFFKTQHDNAAAVHKEDVQTWYY